MHIMPSIHYSINFNRTPELENYDDDNDTGFENWNKEDGGNRGVDYQQMTKIQKTIAIRKRTDENQEPNPLKTLKT